MKWEIEESDGPMTNGIKPPCRVRVWDGTGEKLVGEGTYVGDVKVRFVMGDDGSIFSTDDPEVTAPPGTTVVNENPKIVMDDGSVVYGCQVWWETI
jgi:hypothetical protein